MKNAELNKMYDKDYLQALDAIIRITVEIKDNWDNWKECKVENIEAGMNAYADAEDDDYLSKEIIQRIYDVLQQIKG